MVPLSSHPYGKTQKGESVELHTLTNRKGMEVAVMNFGSTIVSLKVPDRHGEFVDVVLGYDRVEDYEKGDSFFGATIGRYANRIANGRFSLGGKTYLLAKNDGRNTLHGGVMGLGKRVWSARDASSASGPAVQFTYLSKDGEECFPGNLLVSSTFSLSAECTELRIDYTAATDADTVVNLTNHSYFNLRGAGNGNILAHCLKLHAQQFTPVDAALIPTGELKNVVGTPFDFLQPRAIGECIDADNEQLKYGRGYDHNWVIEHKHANSLDLAAEIYDPETKRQMEIFTTEPGIQFYTGNFLDGTIHGKEGKSYEHHSAFCLETQHFPDSPNHPEFPSTRLTPDQRFNSSTVYRFSFR